VVIDLFLSSKKLKLTQCNSRNCRNPGLITEGSKFEVPETPDAGSQNMTLAMPTRQQKDTLGITSPPIPSVESMSPWFQSNLVTSKPKVKQKVSDFVKPKKFSIGLTQNLLESNKCDENDQDVDLLEQMPIRKDNSSNDFASPTLDAAAQVTKTHSVKKKKILAAPQADIAPLSTRTQGSPSIDDNLRHISNPARTEWPIASIERDLVITSKTSNGSLGTRTWLERDAMHLKTLSDKRYTTRELAVIALSAADDSGLTAQEIIDWVAQTFTYLEKGTGSWEKTIRSKISVIPELRRKRVPGASHNMKKYLFVDAATRAHYRAEFAQYCKVTTMPISRAIEFSAPPSNSWTCSKSGGVLSSSRLKKSVLPIMGHPPGILTPESAACSPPQHPTAVSSEKLIMRSMPFERVVERIPKANLSYMENAERETSYKAFLMSQRNSNIEPMTEDAKVRRLADIKARPSRKGFFGSENRLSHIRGYGREDIHDEREGAWKRRRVGHGANSTIKGGDGSLLDGGATTLREVFDLPENAIPMNDGQAELAFRDGTRVGCRNAVPAIDKKADGMTGQ